MKSRIYLTTWFTVTGPTGRLRITDPITEYLGPDGVIPGMRGKYNLKARKSVISKMPEKSFVISVCHGDDGTDFSELDSVSGVVPLDHDRMGIKISSLKRNQIKKIQDHLDNANITVTVSEHDTIGDLLVAVAKDLHPGRSRVFPDYLWWGLQ